MTQTLDPFSFSDFLFKLGCSSICFVSETESCHVAHELSQLLHVNHLELTSKNDTLEIEEGTKKSVFLGPCFENCSHGATITFTQTAAY